MNTVPKKQKPWLTLGHNKLKYSSDNGHTKDLITNSSLKIKRLSTVEVMFLDDLRLGASTEDVIRLLGEPFFIYKSSIIQVYSYGLKSGRDNLIVRCHFSNGILDFGTIEYRNIFLRHDDINSSFGLKYKLNDFIFLRDCIVDSSGNSISFHKEEDTLILIYSKITI